MWGTLNLSSLAGRNSRKSGKGKYRRKEKGLNSSTCENLAGVGRSDQRRVGGP